MQTATFNIIDKTPLQLWRALPAQITITGIDNISGQWQFLLDNDFVDGAIITGVVTDSGSSLIVTINNLESDYIKNAINGKPVLECQGTLTDGENQCFLIPINIQNRCTLQAPPEPLPPAKTFVKSVNEKTGVVVLDASDVGALSNQGKDVIELENMALVPAYNSIYTFTMTADAEFTFNAPASTKAIDFELHIIQGNTTYAVTWPAGIKWGDSDGKFSVNNDAPDLSDSSTEYAITGRLIGNRILMNLAYAEEL